MARDHYLPACVIGRFSESSNTTARKRVVFALRKGKTIAFPVKAENIGLVNDLYRVPSSPILGGDDAPTVDIHVNGYESSLPYALNRLESAKPVDMTTWLRTLVPYVASLFVRGNDFVPRFMARPSLKALGSKLNTIENANSSRIVELERLLSPVCCARWVVLHKTAGEPFLLNDLGLVGTVDPHTGQVGWAIPIGKSSVLGIFPKYHRAVALYELGGWRAIIEHRHLHQGAAVSFNKALAQVATEYVIGPSRESVEKVAVLVGEHADPVALMEGWPFDHRTKLAHAHDWHRLVTATAGGLRSFDLRDLQGIDPNLLVTEWLPPVSIIANLSRPFITGLGCDGNIISLTMDRPQEYWSHFSGDAARSPS